ncbi:MAG TPA: DUF1015 domain-containing protein [Terriglobia bacterium]|nr:DUF1015 domain-containing protein [Terriglobia bacterium]
MAEILPFRALHYNAPALGGLDKLVTQPYDKITPDLQARYYAASPYNLARIIRRRADAAEADPYAATASEFTDWIARGVLASDASPALYPYDQEYELPGQAGVRKRRRGFIGLCRLEDYSAGVVYRHEETLSGPKADRLALLRATRAHFGQIFLLYSDPEGVVERQLVNWTRREPAWESVDDEYRTRHEVWRVNSPGAIAKIQDAMRSRKLVIADGHHRYETALAYRNSLRAQGKGNSAADYVMVTLVRMETDGLAILPTHRVIHGLEGFDWERFLAAARAFFDVKELAAPQPGGANAWQDVLAQVGRGGPAFIAYAGGSRAVVLALRDEAARCELADVPTGLARLDAFVLHRLLIEGALRIDREAVREERNLHYERAMEAAVRAVDEGQAQACFLVNPTPIDAVRGNALAGQVMPQKSTDFYPKMLSGLTIYSLDRS